MLSCPNENLQEFKDLVSRLGDKDLAYFEWNAAEGDSASINEVNYALKAVGILSTDRAEKVFAIGNKNNWSLDKILTELQIPKDQKQLILDNSPKDIPIDIESIEDFEGTIIEYVNHIGVHHDGREIGARNIDKGKRIQVVLSAMRDKFNKKTWTQPATSEPLDKDAFKTFEEFMLFMYLHEKAHEYILQKEGETKGQYETRINNEALRRLNSEYKSSKVKENLRESIILELASNYSYTIEINTAKETLPLSGSKSEVKQDEDGNPYFTYNGSIYSTEKGYNLNNYWKDSKKITQQEFEKAMSNLTKLEERHTKHYAHLTVPGGTNYVEEEVATPAITPSIKGHAQFATDNGIGWVRADEQDKTSRTPITSANQLPNKFTGVNNYTYTKTDGGWLREHPEYESELETDTKELIEIYNYGSQKYEGSKTLRILEIQSDYFQKLRNDFTFSGIRYRIDNRSTQGISYYANGEDITKQEYNKIFEEFIDAGGDNQFLALLHKGDNWITFFIKSIIQDSAKKGYEKVLFPTGNTASKVEGHTTLEGFKKQQEDRIKELEKRRNSKLDELETAKLLDSDRRILERETVNLDSEIITLKQELERIEKEGFAALRPIYKFYEETVTNVLKKQGYNPVLITDEYGNTWNEVTITPKNKSTIYLQKEKSHVDLAREVGDIFNMTETGYINGKQISELDIRNELDKRGLTYIGIGVASSGGKYFKKNGKFWNPYFKWKQKTSTFDREASKSLKNTLEVFMKQVGVTLIDRNAKLKTKDVNAEVEFMLDSSGALLKIIRVANGKEKIDTLPEELAHIFVEMLGVNHPLYKEMRELIEQTEVYQEVYEEYYEDYNGDLEKLAKEAMGKLIAREIVKKHDSNPSLAARIATIIDKFIKTILRAAKIIPEASFEEKISAVFGESAERILKGNTKGLSDENVKSGVFAQKTAGARYKEQEESRKVKSLSEQSAFEQYLSDINNQTARLKRELRPNQPEKNAPIRAEMVKLEGRKLKISLKKDMAILRQFAEEDLTEVKDMLNRFETMSADDRNRLYKVGTQYLNGWFALVDKIARNQEFFGPEAQEQFESIAGSINTLKGQLEEKFKGHFSYLALGGDFNEQDMFGEFEDSNWFESQFLNTSVSKIPLVRKIYDMVQRSNYEARENINKTNKDISEKVKALKAWAKSKGIPDKELWAYFQQVREDGSLTGNYVHDVRQEYYDELRKLNKAIEAATTDKGKNMARAARARWLRVNAITKVKDAEWEIEKQSAKDYFTDDAGILDAAKYMKWEAMHDPRNDYSKYGHNFRESTPNKKLWADSKFNVIQNTPELKEFYDFFIEVMADRKKVLPYSPALYTPNFLPEIAKGAVLNFTDFPGLLKGLGKALGDAFTAEVAPSASYDTESPGSGEPETVIPVYMIGGHLAPQNKNYDLEKVLMAFSTMSYTYEYREKVAPDVLILRDLLATASEQIKNTSGVSMYSKASMRFFEKRKNSLSNALESLNYFLDYSLYDKKKDEPDALPLLSRTTTDENGKETTRSFSFTRFIEVLIRLTRRKGMGINIFAASANMSYGIISNFIEAASGVHFNSADATNALTKILPLAIGKSLTKDSSKILLLMDKFGIMKDFSDTGNEGSSIINTRKIDKLLFIFQEKTEALIYGQLFVAKMLNEKITDSKGKQRSVYEAWKVNDEGELYWDEKEFGSELYEDFSDSKFRMENKLNAIIEDLHGDYDPNNTKLINKGVLGRAMMVFRNWLPQGLYSRFGSERQSERLGEGYIKKGRFRSYLSYFQENESGERLGMIHLLKDVSSELFRQTINMMALGRQVGDWNTLSKLNEVDKANMKRNIAALRMSLVLMATAIIIKGLTDDDDENEDSAALKFLLTTIFRVESDLSFYVNPNAQQVILRDLVPINGTIADITDIFSATIRLVNGDDEISSGPNAGRSNILRQTFQAFPAAAQLQRLYELQGSNVDLKNPY